MTPSYLTISVDDGHPTDLRTAELLARYGLKATFYIPARNPKREVISQPLIRGLAQEFEIGGHTFNHRPLKDLPSQQAWKEINEGRLWMEDVLGQVVPAFCYPKGKFNTTTVKLVEKAGYIGARTCMLNRNELSNNPFTWGVSSQACSHTTVIQVRHAFLEGNFRGIWNFLTVHRGATDWERHFLNGVDWVEQHGGVAHLFFHSWEIDEQRQWKKLERVLKDVSSRKRLLPITNGDLFKLWDSYSTTTISK